MPEFVPESAIDCEAVYRRGGENLGSKHFRLFKCPSCKTVYLIDCRMDTIYLDGHDLSRRNYAGEPLICTSCHHFVPDGPLTEERQVTWQELQASAWAWVTTPKRSFGDEI